MPDREMEQKPRGSVRWIYFGPVSAVLMGFFTVVSYYRFGPVDLIPFMIFNIAGLLMAFVTCREMWTLKAKQMSSLAGFLVAAASGVTVFVLLVLNDLGLFVWNRMYLEFALTLYFCITGIVAVISERRNSVKIYVDLQGTKFVRERRENA